LSLRVVSPVAGHSLAVSDIPDPVFAKGLVGPGTAIRPRGGRQVAVAPVSGVLTKLHPHAYLIMSDSGNGVLVAEAGTGTGKTFAYLVPALLTGGKVIVSTGTKTLQDQLFDRDLPAVREALATGGTAALLKEGGATRGSLTDRGA